MRIVVRPQRLLIIAEKEKKKEGLESFGFIPQTPESKLESFPEEETKERPSITSYVNPYYRLDQEMRKRGFRRLKSPDYLTAAQGRRRGNYGPDQPEGRFASYNGTVYVKEPAPNYIWVSAGWIPEKPSAGPNGDMWCAYWSPTPTGVVTRCGKTVDEAVDILLEFIDREIATPGDEKGRTMNLKLPPPAAPISWPTPSGETIRPNEQGTDIFTDDRSLNAHVRLEEGDIVVDVFDNTIEDATAAVVDGETFDRTAEGTKEATNFLREHGFRQTIETP